jgi:NAD(P)-dependent dehydrogenase (short-subunit alcohol dehydrogenase family)
MAEQTGNRPLALRADITDTAALRAAFAEAEARHGPARILVNNAADDDRHSTERVDEAYWERCVAINLKAYFFAAQTAIERMKRHGGGAIVNISSIAYMMGNAGYPLYTMANAGINGLTRSLAREFGPDGIRVNALAPGWVMTDKQKALWVSEAALSAHLDRQCLKRPLVPEDIVGGALFLASDSARMMTGQALVIDGGVVVTG